MKFLLGKKRGMSHIWKENEVIPVTLIEAGPMTVTAIRTEDRDGYRAVQVGFGTKKRTNKAQAGQFDGRAYQYIREFRLPEGEDAPEAGSDITVSTFEEGDLVKIAGITKGRGFQGVVKRHGFGGGPKTHGNKHHERAPGSIGSQEPQRVIKGKRMAGHMGVDRVTVKNLEIVAIDTEKNVLMIKGAVPGNNGGLLEIVEA